MVNPGGGGDDADDDDGVDVDYRDDNDFVDGVARLHPAAAAAAAATGLGLHFGDCKALLVVRRLLLPGDGGGHPSLARRAPACRGVGRRSRAASVLLCRLFFLLFLLGEFNVVGGERRGIPEIAGSFITLSLSLRYPDPGNKLAPLFSVCGFFFSVDPESGRIITPVDEGLEPDSVADWTQCHYAIVGPSFSLSYGRRRR